MINEAEVAIAEQNSAHREAMSLVLDLERCSFFKLVLNFLDSKDVTRSVNEDHLAELRQEVQDRHEAVEASARRVRAADNNLLGAFGRLSRAQVKA